MKTDGKKGKALFKVRIDSLQSWAQNKIFGLFVFNLLIMLLIVLRSAGYFEPFFLITINFIVFVSLVLAIFLLNIRSSMLFIIALVFWILTALLRVINIEVWAQRAAIYTFQSLIVGLVLFVIEVIRSKNKV